MAGYKCEHVYAYLMWRFLGLEQHIAGLDDDADDGGCGQRTMRTRTQDEDGEAGTAKRRRQKRGEDDGNEREDRTTTTKARIERRRQRRRDEDDGGEERTKGWGKDKDGEVDVRTTMRATEDAGNALTRTHRACISAICWGF